MGNSAQCVPERGGDWAHPVAVGGTTQVLREYLKDEGKRYEGAP